MLAFRARLENHIRDVERGRGGLSPEVGREVRRRHLENAAALASPSASNLGAYSFLTGHGPYRVASRAVAALHATTRAIERMQTPPPAVTWPADPRAVTAHYAYQASAALAAPQLSVLV